MITRNDRNEGGLSKPSSFIFISISPFLSLFQLYRFQVGLSKVTMLVYLPNDTDIDREIERDREKERRVALDNTFVKMDIG